MKVDPDGKILSGTFERGSQLVPLVVSADQGETIAKRGERLDAKFADVHQVNPATFPPQFPKDARGRLNRADVCVIEQTLHGSEQLGPEKKHKEMLGKKRARVKIQGVSRIFAATAESLAAESRSNF